MFHISHLLEKFLIPPSSSGEEREKGDQESELFLLEFTVPWSEEISGPSLAWLQT